MPDGSDSSFVVAAESYLDQIETILQQFMDYAGSGEREAAEPGDLNALIERLAGDFAGLGHEFELSLAVLPTIAYRPISMMRLLMTTDAVGGVWQYSLELAAALQAEVGGPILSMSGVSREGLTEVLRALWQKIEPTRKPKVEKTTTWQP